MRRAQLRSHTSSLQVHTTIHCDVSDCHTKCKWYERLSEKYKLADIAGAGTHATPKGVAYLSTLYQSPCSSIAVRHEWGPEGLGGLANTHTTSRCPTIVRSQAILLCVASTGTGVPPPGYLLTSRARRNRKRVALRALGAQELLPAILALALVRDTLQTLQRGTLQFLQQ